MKINKKLCSEIGLGILSAIIICVMVTGVLTFHRVYRNLNRRLDAIIAQNTNQILGYINGQKIELNLLDEKKEIEVNSLNAEWKMPIRFSFNSNYEITFDGIKMESDKDYLYKFRELSDTSQIMIKVKEDFSGETYDFTLKTLPENISRFQCIGKSPEEGDYYLTTTNGYGTLYKLDENGKIMYYRFSEKKRFSDFKKVKTPDGITRYIYGEEYQSINTLQAATTPVEWVILDEQYHEIKRLRMRPSKKILTNNYPADQHDILFIDDDNYYLLGYVAKTVDNIPENTSDLANGDRIIACIIQGFEKDRLVFEWDSSDYPELYELSVEGKDYPRFADYAHANSIDMDKKDGNIIISFRNLDTICKIDTNSGNILWNLGGVADSFNLTEDQKMSKQHYARYNSNGSISVYDNGNSQEESRVVEYWLDEDSKKLIDFHEYKQQGYYSYATGSAQRISSKEDIFVIGWGMKNEKSAGLNQPSLSEINFSTNEVYFELFMNNNIDIYRCVKYK